MTEPTYFSNSDHCFRSFAVIDRTDIVQLIGHCLIDVHVYVCQRFFVYLCLCQCISVYEVWRAFTAKRVKAVETSTQYHQY